MDLPKGFRIIIKGNGASVAQVSAPDISIEAATRDAEDLRRGADAALDSGTILSRTSHADEQRAFSRNFKKTFPIASRGEGCWIISSDGRRFLDASGQAAVVSIGHGVTEIGRVMAEQSSQIAFANTSQFHTAPAEKLAARLLAVAPANFRNGGRVYFTSGGSEATETVIKLARQFHMESGQKDRYRVLSRRQSYHGSTLGAMSVSGNVARRAPYEPLIVEWGHIAPCFCYHCPFEKIFPQCQLTYPTQGCVDGMRGDHILLAPPSRFRRGECALIARALQLAVAKVFPS